jgi:hypothetical protein
VAAGDLTTLASVREFLRIPTAQTDADALLTTLIAQASSVIEQYTSREFAPESTGSQTRTFQYHGGSGILYLIPWDLRSVTLMQIDTETDSPQTLTADEDYFLMPRRAPGGVYEYVELRGLAAGSRAAGAALKPWREVEITGTWGYSAVPDAVKLAANMLVAFWWRQHSAVPGRELAGEGDRFGPVNMPSGVMQLLAPYRVVGFG